jgi:hypothetical protein
MIFNQFTDTDVVLGRTIRVSSGFWADGNFAHSQSALFTSSTQTQLTGSNGATDIKNGLYYFNVYNGNPNPSDLTYDISSQVHFSIAYGDYYGSGSGDGNTSSLANTTKAIYSQYKNTLLTPNDTLFNFKTGSYTNVAGNITDNTSTITGSSIYVISFTTDKFKDRIDEGQIEFTISGANGIFTFIDDSTVVKSQQDTYNIISGSIINGVATPYYSGNSVNYQSIGILYPKTGDIVLNAAALSSSVGVAYDNGITGAYKVNQKYLYKALVAAGTVNGNVMKVRKSEFLPSRQYFVRVKNQDFNYSNNPSYVSDGTDGNTKGSIIINEFLTDPKAYPTTVGLYDDSNELVAVAKLSQPVQKSFNNELLIRVRLDF